MKAYNVINTRIPRVDARVKATGEARYSADLSMPNMLYAALLQSPIAHGRILNIDISAAKRLPGVKDAIPVTKPYKLVSREVQPESTVVHVGDVPIGNGHLRSLAAWRTSVGVFTR